MRVFDGLVVFFEEFLNGWGFGGLVGIDLLVVQNVGLGAIFQKKLYNVVMVVLGRIMQGRVQIFILRVDIDLGIDENLYAIIGSLQSPDVQRRTVVA